MSGAWTSFLVQASVETRANSGSSDGDWDDWEEAQTIVKVLWPGEEVACPWNENGNEDDEDEEED